MKVHKTTQIVVQADVKQGKIPKSYGTACGIKLIRSGESYFNCLLRLINKATSDIQLQTYIFDDDETGNLVAAALIAAAKRNVSVYVLADGYASQNLSNKFIADLIKAGIHFRYFEPVFKSRSFYFGRRLHHKIAVFDAAVALVGGINISNNYNDLPGKSAWLDFALYLEGNACELLQIYCKNIWDEYKVSKIEESKIPAVLKHAVKDDRQYAVKISRNDWVKRKTEISKSYVEMFLYAKSSITILCSYFLPGKAIRKQIAAASKRGITIRVITTGRSDIAVSKYAERWLYDWLLRKGVIVYEYQQNVLHGKLAVCDDAWVTIGSYNINNISAYASVELNMEVKDAGFAKLVRHQLEEIITMDCIQINDLRRLKNRNLVIQFLRWSSYQFIRMMTYLFTFYFKRKP